MGADTPEEGEKRWELELGTRALVLGKVSRADGESVKKDREARLEEEVERVVGGRKFLPGIERLGKGDVEEGEERDGRGVRGDWV